MKLTNRKHTPAEVDVVLTLDEVNHLLGYIEQLQERVETNPGMHPEAVRVLESLKFLTKLA